MEVTNEHQKWLKISTQSGKKWLTGSPPQELEVSPRSGLYLLVYFNNANFRTCLVFHMSMLKKIENVNFGQKQHFGPPLKSMHAPCINFVGPFMTS